MLVHLDVLSLDHRQPPWARQLHGSLLATSRLVLGSQDEVLLEGLPDVNYKSDIYLYIFQISQKKFLFGVIVLDIW